MISGAPFTKAAAPETSAAIIVAQTFMPKAEAFATMLRTQGENRIILYDRKLDPRIFDIPMVKDALNLYLERRNTGLEVFTSAQTLRNYTAHPHNDFIDLLQERPNTTLRASNAVLDADFFWSSCGKTYISSPQSADYGTYFSELGPLHQRLESMFLTMARQASGPGPLL